LGRNNRGRSDTAENRPVVLRTVSHVNEKGKREVDISEINAGFAAFPVRCVNNFSHRVVKFGLLSTVVLMYDIKDVPAGDHVFSQGKCYTLVCALSIYGCDRSTPH